MEPEIVLEVLKIVAAIALWKGGEEGLRRFRNHRNGNNPGHGNMPERVAVLEEQIESAEKRLEVLGVRTHWMADCITVLGAKSDIDLPPRPSGA